MTQDIARLRELSERAFAKAPTGAWDAIDKWENDTFDAKEELSDTMHEWLPAILSQLEALEAENKRLRSKVDAFTNGETFLYLRTDDQEKAAAELSDADLVKWVRWALVASAEFFTGEDRSAMEVLTMHSVINLAALVHASNADRAMFSVSGASWKGAPDGGDWRVTIEREIDGETAATARIGVLEKALEPFADEADAWSPEQNAGHLFDDEERVDQVDHLRVKHLRAARTALARGGESGE